MSCAHRTIVASVAFRSFAQQPLRNAGQLVRIDPSLGMADFISNSAILTTIRPSTVLTVASNSDP